MGQVGLLEQMGNGASWSLMRELLSMSKRAAGATVDDLLVGVSNDSLSSLVSEPMGSSSSTQYRSPYTHRRKGIATSPDTTQLFNRQVRCEMHPFGKEPRSNGNGPTRTDHRHQ